MNYSFVAEGNKQQTRPLRHHWRYFCLSQAKNTFFYFYACFTAQSCQSTYLVNRANIIGASVKNRFKGYLSVCEIDIIFLTHGCVNVKITIA